MTEKILHRTAGDVRKKPTRSQLDELADRESEAFHLFGEGVRTAEIAQRLHLSIKTIEIYRERVRHKLDQKEVTSLAYHTTKLRLVNG